MKVRSLCPLAAALGVWVGGSAVAAEPALPVLGKLTGKVLGTKQTPPPKPVTPKAGTPAVSKAHSGATKADSLSDNQKLAEAIAERLVATGSGDGADVSMSTEGGIVTVTGTVRDMAQKKAVLEDIRVVPGVKMIKDGIQVGGGIRQVSAEAQPSGPGVPPGVGPMAPMPPVGIPPGPVGGGIEPMPVGHPGMGPADGFAPPLPPYAWPTYAPYNNVSRVAYPQAYPYNAFPFIGPFYPFPKVPLGWRTVQLEWEDGHWWLGRKAAPQDYWRVRFW